MNRYTIARLQDPADLATDALGRAFGMPAGLEEAKIELYPWDENGYRPRCGARVGWNREGLHVFLYALETETRSRVTKTGGWVCHDSCLEFFLNPNPSRGDAYMNYECSVRPCVFLGLGDGRRKRRVLGELPPGMSPSATTVVPGLGWAVRYRIAADFLLREFSITLAPGLEMRGNFFKCGDLTRFPHFGVWNPIDTAAHPQPDFHRPEYFGSLVLG